MNKHEIEKIISEIEEVPPCASLCRLAQNRPALDRSFCAAALKIGLTKIKSMPDSLAATL